VTVSGAFLSACFKSLKKKIDNGSVKVTTIALRPDKQNTGKWKKIAELPAVISIMYFYDVLNQV